MTCAAILPIAARRSAWMSSPLARAMAATIPSNVAASSPISSAEARTLRGVRSPCATAFARSVTAPRGNSTRRVWSDTAMPTASVVSESPIRPTIDLRSRRRAAVTRSSISRSTLSRSSRRRRAPSTSYDTSSFCSRSAASESPAPRASKRRVKLSASACRKRSMSVAPWTRARLSARAGSSSAGENPCATARISANVFGRTRRSVSIQLFASLGFLASVM